MAGIWYRAGTVAVTTGSAKVVGTGTTWRSGVYKPDKGHIFWGPDGRAYEVDYVESDTVLYLVTAYAGGPATGQTYSIVISITGQVPAFSRELSAFVAYHQSQMDGWQQLLTGTGNVTLTAPDGTKLTVPSIYAIGKAVPDHEAKAGAHPISGVEGLQAALDKRVLTSGGAISNLRRAGQESGSLVSNVAAPLPNNDETVVYNSFAIKLLSGWTSTMVRFRVVIRDYLNRHRNVDITFSGYVYSDTQNWVAEASGASAVGTGALDWQVYTHKISDGTPVIYIYNPNGYDDYSTVEIVDDVSRGVQPVYAVDRVVGYAGTPVNVSRHYHSGNVVGPLSGGAIIERGANANGEYVKWADGTMICCLSNFNIPETAINSGFGRPCVLPATFSSIDSMRPVASVLSTNSGSLEASGSLYRNGFSLTVLDGSRINFNGYTYVSAIQTPLTIGIQVIGRWS
ncbi:hypothetical protein SJS40_07210 [Aeromonas caviae]|uniref:hypothetical protein n=1 Tax=Aeromonas caviae TaxID=648 RepID=UPI0029D42959|nr:hypothetical protein [Aeromonas caviae]MDX7753349.1 hypothetical protein [Aeromonas caviae]MDX7774099.1 hypothetical protein [Aeromonas caviae]